MNRQYWYKLDGHTPVPVERLEDTKALWDDADARRVALTHVGEVQISTVFLVLDHNWTDGPPILFETMVFGGELDGEQARYSTWEEAEMGHIRMIECVKEAEKNKE